MTNQNPQWTVRARLTTLYGTMFLISGATLLAVVYVLVRQGARRRSGQIQYRVEDTPIPGVRRIEPETVHNYVDRATDAALEQLLFWSILSLIVLAIVSVAIGWWVAGVVLGPLNQISATARRLSSDNLHERIRLDGPPDELTELATTFDDMLDRLQTAFDSQRRFIGNASHELRTPLAIQRAAIQIGLNDDASPQEIALVREQLLDANRRSERLIDGLLLLARSDRGLDHREPVPLHTVVTDLVERHRPEATRRKIAVRTEIHPASVLGDRLLITQLVENLVINAIRHNVEGGSVLVRVGHDGLSITNTGARIDALALSTLFEPFQRGAQRTSGVEGSGLGLSIVRSIVNTHGGQLHAQPNSEGGLAVTVRLPVPAPPREAAGPRQV